MTPDRRCTTYSARPARLEREGDPEPWLGKQRASIRTSVRAEGPRLMSLVVHIVPFEMGARLPPGSHRQRDKGVDQYQRPGIHRRALSGTAWSSAARAHPVREIAAGLHPRLSYFAADRAAK